MESETKPKKKMVRYFAENAETKTPVVASEMQKEQNQSVKEDKISKKSKKRKKTKEKFKEKKREEFRKRIKGFKQKKKEGLKKKKEDMARRSRAEPEKDEQELEVEEPKPNEMKYVRGEQINVQSVVTNYHKEKMKQKEKRISEAVRQSARAELLLQEEAGFLEADDGEMTVEVSQYDILRETDITTATKSFNLSLKQFGPYHINYSRNGRHLLLGGAKGHVAAMDWQTKKLMCEINVMETVNDVKWLHIETMFAVAQRRWVYIYDNQGVELHCLKFMNNVLNLEFLPYHFLLAASSGTGHLHWLDVSIGQKVASFHANKGRLGVMCQNPSNAILHCGHSGGTVSLWSPNVREPLIQMLCHSAAVRAIQVDRAGNHMVTSSDDLTLKVWDIRHSKRELYKTHIGTGASHLSISQRGLLAVAANNVVEVYKDAFSQPIKGTYMRYKCQGHSVKSLQFCNHEDVLGVGHDRGFTSLLIPGSGEPNFDTFESNPFESKKQRREAEVKQLLDKIQPELISLHTDSLSKMAQTQQKKLLSSKLEKIDFVPRYKTKGKSKTGNFEQRKSYVRMERRMQQIRAVNKEKERQLEKIKNSDSRTPEKYSVFNRFKKGPT